MKNCPICSRENDYYGWCFDCRVSYSNRKFYLSTDEGKDRAEWAASRAREFEKEKAMTTLNTLEDVIVHGIKERIILKDGIEGLKKKIKILVDGLEEIINMGHASDGEWSCEGYCHVEAAQEALEEYRKEN